jgi:hypothetical protein
MQLQFLNFWAPLIFIIFWNAANHCFFRCGTIILALEI